MVTAASCLSVKCLRHILRHAAETMVLKELTKHIHDLFVERYRSGEITKGFPKHSMYNERPSNSHYRKVEMGHHADITKKKTLQNWRQKKKNSQGGCQDLNYNIKYWSLPACNNRLYSSHLVCGGGVARQNPEKNIQALLNLAITCSKMCCSPIKPR